MLERAIEILAREEAYVVGGTVRDELLHRPVLDLDMVDYYAEVFVNGASVGKHEGYFQRWSVDLSSLRKGKNTICVKVSAPTFPLRSRQRLGTSGPHRWRRG